MDILIVEDEAIIARDLQNTLQRLGHGLPRVVDRGEDALVAVSDHPPDLILMDIRLRGTLDGIETARRIRRGHPIPIIYLTAHADAETVQHAAFTEPYGYLVKPFAERDLVSAITVAAHKAKVEQQIRDSERRLAAAMRYIDQGVLLADERGHVIYISPVAAELIGIDPLDALNQPLARVYVTVDAATHLPVDDLVARALGGGQGAAVPPTALLLARDGRASLVSQRVIAGPNAPAAVTVVFQRARPDEPPDNGRRWMQQRAERAESGLDQLHRGMAALDDLARRLQRCVSAAEVAVATSDAAALLFPAGSGALFLYQDGQLDLIAAWGDRPLRRPAGCAEHCPAIHFGAAHIPALAPGDPCDPLPAGRPSGVSRCVPLIVGGAPVGLIRIGLGPVHYDPAVAGDTPADRERIAALLSAQVAFALGRLSRSESALRGS